MPTNASAAQKVQVSRRDGSGLSARSQRARAARRGRKKAQQRKRQAAGVLVGAVILAMVVSVIYSQAQVTRLSSEIDETRQELTNAKSTYDYLSSQMSSITTNANVQQIAEGELGLVKSGNDQITYIRLQDETCVERTENEPFAFFSDLKTTLLSLIGSPAS